jgi:hypothetical protein
MILDGKSNDIPLTASLDESLQLAEKKGIKVSDLIIGLAPDGGRLPQTAIPVIENALRSGMNIISGLHDFLIDNKKLVSLANDNHCRLVDIRKPPERHLLNFFSGKIEQVDSMKIAMLGTDSAVGKRTTAWLLADAFNNAGYKAEMKFIINTFTSNFEDEDLGSLPKIPIVVFVGTKYTEQFSPPGLENPFEKAGKSMESHKVLQKNRIESYSKWISESPEGYFIVSPKASHYFHLDEPQMVVEMIKRLIESE